MGASGNVENFVQTLNSAIQAVGYEGVINALKSIQSNQFETIRNNRISQILLQTSIEFGYDLGELLSKASFKGEKAICVKTMAYLLYSRENLTLGQIAKILPVDSESAVSKQKSYIETLDKNIPYHSTLLQRVAKINRILDQKNDTNGRTGEGAE